MSKTERQLPQMCLKPGTAAVVAEAVNTTPV